MANHKQQLQRIALLCGLLPSVGACGIELTQQSLEDRWRSERESGLEQVGKRSYKAAEPHLQQAVILAQRLEKVSPSHYAQSLQELGDLQVLLGQKDRASNSYQKSAAAYEISAKTAEDSEIYKRVGRFGRAKVLLALGKLELEAGNYSQSASLLRQSYELASIGFGSQAVLPEIKEAYAMVLAKLGRKDEAKQLLDENNDDPLQAL